MFTALQAPLAFGLIAAFVTSVGLLLVATRGDWSRRHSGLFALAAAGMLLTLTLLHIAPEAFATTNRAPEMLLTGFLGGLFLSFVIRAFFPDDGGPGTKSEAFTPLIAISIHSFIDGVIYAVTFAASFEAGVFTSLSLILHEFPEGVIAFAILRRYGYTNRGAFIGAFLASALTTPLGVLVAVPFVETMGTSMIGVLFALSAGLLLYVATGPLMAPMQQERPTRGLMALFTGVGVALLVSLTPLHDHDHAHEHAQDSGTMDVYISQPGGH